MARSLERLLRPRTIAVFGGREARRVIEQCDRLGFAGQLWPVHPTKENILGRRCYRRVEDLPAAPDAAFIGVNRVLTVEIVRALADRGAGGAICYASGFREAAGLDGAAVLQDDLVAAAGEMPVIGPNCYGLINAMDAALLWPDQHGLVRETGGVAILTQSSNIAINMSMQTRGLPIAYLMTAGNQAQTGISTLATGVLEDPRVTAVGLHIEGFDNLQELERLAARARDLRKPIVALKVGRSEAARKATVSHTASLAGDDQVSGAVLKRLGIGRAHSIPELIEALKVLHVHGPLRSFDIASMSCSGGEAAIMADSAQGRRIRFRGLSAEHAAPLQAVLGEMVIVANPLDYHTFIWADEERMTRAFSAMMRSGFALTMLVLDLPRSDRCDASDWMAAIAAMKAASVATGEHAAIVSTLPETMPEALARDLAVSGIVPLCGIDEALGAAAIAAEIGAAWARPPATPLLVPESVASGPGLHEARMLDEDEAKRALARFGVVVPEGRTVTDSAAACEAARELGFPVAVKALGIAHKTEAGAVRLGLPGETEVRLAVKAMAKLASRFLVERMAPAPVAELIVGVTRDPVAGPVMTVGAGGILVELIRDAAVLTLPASREDVRAALASLATWKLLDSHRGRPKGDIDAAIEAILAVGRFVEANVDRIEELDVNPLMVLPQGQGAIAVDALIRMRGQLE